MKTKRMKITNSTIEQLKREHKNKCAHCKCSLLSNEFHIDHIIALKDGGIDAYDNLQPLCVDCHSKKTGATGLMRGQDFKKACGKCGRVIKGFNEKQVNALIKFHQLGKKCYKVGGSR